MAAHTSEFIATLAARGYIQDATDLPGLDALAAKGPVTAYIGFDCTGPSLHVGHLVQVMMLRWLQKTGHRPIVLLGGGTTKVGDPSGKDSARQLLSDADIAANMARLRGVFSRFLEFGEGPGAALMVNNDDWLQGLRYIPFLRDIGRHFSINRMLGFDSVKLRLEREQPLSFLEFNYMILQAYDFLELYRRHGCVLQMGGSDQWGNIVNGLELIRRIEGGEAHGLTTALITTADGAKMGKTAKGAVWLNDAMLPAYDYWQFWRNTHDGDVGRFLRLFTDLPLDEIARLEALGGSEINEAKKVLANQATALCRGADAARDAAHTAQRTFEEGAVGAALPRLAVSPARLEAGLGLLDALVESGLAASKGDARRLVRGGGVKVDDARAENELAQLFPADMGEKGHIKLSAGKKRHALITLE
ncbi:MAG: tyrosine--tRNA ligase [Pseudomonadota bacterium]